MQVRTIECECGHEIYMGGEKVTCPACFRGIHLVKDEPYVIDTNVPILNTFKFSPSSIVYFGDRYPVVGDFILLIFLDNTVSHILWKESHVGWYETVVQEGNSKTHPLSWKLLTEEEWIKR